MREEVVEARTATQCEIMQLSWDRMSLRELQDERKAVAAFIDSVKYRLTARNERLRHDVNTLVATYTTDLAKTTDIRPTVASVRQTQEAARAHAVRFVTPHPQMQASRLDPIPPRSSQPQQGGPSSSGPGGPSSAGA